MNMPNLRRALPQRLMALGVWQEGCQLERADGVAAEELGRAGREEARDQADGAAPRSLSPVVRARNRHLCVGMWHFVECGRVAGRLESMQVRRAIHREHAWGQGLMPIG